MKLFVTDYDDTLYTDEKQIKRNIIKLRELQERDFLIVISTGRSYPSIKRLTNLYQIPYNYLSCSDGSVIYNQKGEIVKSFVINPKIIEPLQNFYQNLHYEEIQFSYANGYLNHLQDEEKLFGINICLANDNVTDELKTNFMKLKTIHPNYNYLIYKHPYYTFLCVKPKNVSKSLAVAYLQKMEKVLSKDIYIIGDSQNDLEMIKDFHGVGMKNSCPEILNVAKKTYASPEDYINDILKNN